MILDGTWRDPQRRAHVRELAAALHAPMLEIMCRTDVDTAVRRVTARPADHVSDATGEIAQHLEMDARRYAGAGARHRGGAGRGGRGGGAKLAGAGRAGVTVLVAARAQRLKSGNTYPEAQHGVRS